MPPLAAPPSGDADASERGDVGKAGAAHRDPRAARRTPPERRRVEHARYRAVGERHAARRPVGAAVRAHLEHERKRDRADAAHEREVKFLARRGARRGAHECVRRQPDRRGVVRAEAAARGGGLRQRRDSAPFERRRARATSVAAVARATIASGGARQSSTLALRQRGPIPRRAPSRAAHRHVDAAARGAAERRR